MDPLSPTVFSASISNSHILEKTLQAQHLRTTRKAAILEEMLHASYTVGSVADT